MAEGAPAEYHFHSPMRSQMAALARKHKMLTERERARRALEMRNAHLEALWDSSKHTICPPNLKGLKPVTHEPWARDATVYAQKTGSFERVANRDQHGSKTDFVTQYNDESVLDSNNPDAARRYRSHVTATGLAKNASLGEQPKWDSSPLRHCPHVLRGISPVTREPWWHDEQVYNRDTTNDTSQMYRAGGGALDMGSISHKTRAKMRQVDRPGFYTPNYEKWAALLSA